MQRDPERQKQTRAGEPTHPPADTTPLDRKMQRTRIALTGSYLLIGCAAYLTGAVSGHPVMVLGAIAVMPLSGVAVLLLLNRPGTPKAPGVFTAAALALDTLLASWVVFWTGGAASPCLPFYLTPVLAAAFRFGPRGSLLFTLLAVAGYTVAGGLPSPVIPDRNPVAEGVLRVVILFAASAVGFGALHRKMDLYRKEKASRRQAERANRDMEAAYRELREAQDQLLHAEKLSSLGRLVAGVAHEINNPISFVYGNLVHLERYVGRLRSLLAFFDLLPLPPEDENQKDALKHEMDYDYLWEDMEKALTDSRTGAERVRKIVAALSQFSRLRTGTFRRVDLREVIGNAVYLLERTKGRGARLLLDCPEEAVVYGDPDELNQLFVNLLSNALDAMHPTGGTVRVRTVPSRGHTTPGGPLIVEVEDNGPGIPPAIRDRVFEPFFTTKEVGHGTGLGLSIAYGIARRHRGGIALLEAPEGGCLFRVTLPRWQAPCPDQPSSPAADRPAGPPLPVSL